MSTIQVRPPRVDVNDDWSGWGRSGSRCGTPGDEDGRRRREPTVDVIPEEPGSDSLTMEDDVVTPRPNGIVYNEGVRSTRQTPLSRMWERTLRNRSLPSPTVRLRVEGFPPDTNPPGSNGQIVQHIPLSSGINRAGFVFQSFPSLLRARPSISLLIRPVVTGFCLHYLIKTGIPDMSLDESSLS